MMQFWEDDDRTAVVGLYLESIGNPRKFSRLARRLSPHQAGDRREGRTVRAWWCRPGTPSGRRRPPPRALDEMLRQSGVIRVENTTS